MKVLRTILKICGSCEFVISVFDWLIQSEMLVWFAPACRMQVITSLRFVGTKCQMPVFVSCFLIWYIASSAWRAPSVCAATIPIRRTIRWDGIGKIACSIDGKVVSHYHSTSYVFVVVFTSAEVQQCYAATQFSVSSRRWSLIPFLGSSVSRDHMCFTMPLQNQKIWF